MTWLLNAFSLSLLGGVPRAVIHVRALSVDEARELARGATSAVGHDSTARLFATLLGQPVACDRLTVTLHPGDTALVGQYAGPRLPEGATHLPAGGDVRWYHVTLEPSP